ncbi:type VI secretion system protein TssA [Proteus alimentorum]|uniref:Type VI secretion system protein TssA n=1 Tax=Proteus alimentorum TaxID=1973495 RepID=A0ABS0IY49_9GAMM|nr:type VI secretion system protein TssA [Proteus alimentorum]MBG2876571.1 type VI secretion system protein TssA [Proteus alimentorum]MBG2880898.1 type VI secretion system protein TssA [Proteus alimentorum]
MTTKTLSAWREQLLAPLDEAQLSSQLDENNADWEYIESEMIKFGSLSHGTLDIDDIQRRALQLFETQTKDFRLLVHFLRTLQHAAIPEELVIGATIASAYMQHYWDISYPSNSRLKLRLAQQILKRFESVKNSFCQQATPEQRDDILGEFAYLAQFWHTNQPSLSTQMDELSLAYQHIENTQKSTIIIEESVKTEPINEVKTPSQTPIKVTSEAKQHHVELNQSDDRQWKQTLLKVAGILCEQAPNDAIGYRLRRYAIWHNIQTLPMSDKQGKTPLAAVAIDRVTDYKAQLTQPTLTLLNQIEQSLTLAPYWLDGHYIAAQAAQSLELTDISSAIAQELSLFLTRLPQLNHLYFSDMTRFISEETRQWLSSLESKTHNKASPSLSLQSEQQEIMTCFEQEGLNAALLMIDNAISITTEPRQRFYLQLLSAQLFEASKMSSIANVYFNQLYQDALRYSLSEWEPNLLSQLASQAEHQQNSSSHRE